jgi:hypothetical protein
MNKKKLPSVTSAILFGFIGMPLFIFGINFISQKTGSNILLIIWSIIGFALPFLVSTTDISHLRKNLFRVRLTKEEFKKFYFPAWKRMVVWFISACASILLLKLIGINIG